MPEAGLGALLSNNGKVTEFSIQNLVLASNQFTCNLTGFQALPQNVLNVDNLKIFDLWKNALFYKYPTYNY